MGVLLNLAGFKGFVGGLLLELDFFDARGFFALDALQLYCLALVLHLGERVLYLGVGYAKWYFRLEVASSSV